MINDPSYSYKQGSYYENFMCRAFRTSDNSKSGMHGSYMQNLIDAERGETLMKELGSFDKQLIKVKKHMNNAFDKYLKMKLPVETLEILQRKKSEVDTAESTSELLEIIERVMTLTQSVKNY